MEEEGRGGERKLYVCNEFYNGFLLDTHTMGGLPLGSAPKDKEQ